MKKIIFFIFILIFSLSIYSQDLFSAAFFQEDIRSAISQLSYDSGVTIISDPKIAGYVTLEVYDKPIETILDMLLMPFGYAWKRIDDYILIGIPDPSSGTSIHLNDTYIMKTRFLTPENIINLLPKYFQNFVSFSQRDNNFIVINAPPKIAGTIANTIRKIDIGRPEVNLEIKVVQIDSQILKQWNISSFEVTPEYERKDFNNNEHFEITQDNLGILFKNGGIDYGIILDKAISEGHAQVVANSKIIVISGETGTLSGKLTESFVKGDSGYVDFTGFEFVVNPYLMPGKKVRLNSKIQLKDRRDINQTVPSYIDNQLESTFVLNLDEETTVAAFNYSSVFEKEIGIPLLSSIPGIGSIFKTKIDKKIEQQLIFIVNCHAAGGEVQ